MQHAFSRVAVVFLLVVGVLSTAGPSVIADEEGGGNNLAVPVIFAEGYGTSGFEVDETDPLSTGLPGLLKCGGIESWPASSENVTFNDLGVATTTAEEEPPIPVHTYELVIDGTVYDRLEGQSTADPGGYYLQPYSLVPYAGGAADAYGGSTCYEADWIDGATLAGPVEVDIVDWGDDLIRVLWSEGNNPIRVELNFFQTAADADGTFQGGTTLMGYAIEPLWPPPFSDGRPPAVGEGEKLEVWAVPDDGGGSDLLPAPLASVYSQNARMTIHELTWAMMPDSFQDADLTGYPTGAIPNTMDPGYDDWIANIELDSLVGGEEGGGVFSSEVNQGGRVLYGLSWGLDGGVDSGWYRITVSLDETAYGVERNAVLLGVSEEDTTPDESSGSGGGKKAYFPPTFVEDATAGNYTFIDVYVADDSAAHGKMHGRVTDDDGAVLEGIEVTVYDPSGVPVGATLTDASGEYDLSILAGAYKISFEDPGGNYVAEWYDDASGAALAETVIVSDSGTAHADAVLAQAAYMSGRVLGRVTAARIQGASVGLYGPTGEHVGTWITDENGQFNAALEEGAYTVHVMADGYLDTWYNDRPSMADADPVQMQQGETFSLTIRLTPGGWFGDVSPDNAYAVAIKWLQENGITQGCDENSFCPLATVTRAQMASFLARALNLSEGGDTDWFDDDNGSVHEENINRIATEGITLGCEAGKFCPDRPISRAQMASLLARALNLSEGGDTDWFDDDNGSVHEENINRIATEGITLGCEAGKFCPMDPVLRQHMAAFLYRAMAE